jgi:N-acetylneuraminate synthase/sialic acid synthase
MEMKIGNTLVGDGHPCYVIAEGGCNHQGKLSVAIELIKEAKRVGASAIKFQKRDMRALMTRELYNSPYNKESSFGRTYGEHRVALELSREDWIRLKGVSFEVGITLLSSVWDIPSSDFINGLDLPVIKIPSACLSDLYLLEHVIGFRKPIIVSTGMSNILEIGRVDRILAKSSSPYSFLHCVSEYPVEDSLTGLSFISILRNMTTANFIGYSGHEKSGNVVSLGAVALGAKILERHFTLDRTMRGSDHSASLEPNGFRQLVESVRVLESAMGEYRGITEGERNNRIKLGKSLVAARDIKSGSIITRECLTFKSPGQGFREDSLFLNREAVKDITEGDMLDINCIK